MSTIHTSYYGSPRLSRIDYYLVQISNSVPKNFVPDRRWNEVIPDWCTMVAPSKDGLISHKEYERRYRRMLDQRKESIERTFTENISRSNRTPVLMCYEAPNKFCHRHILAKWLVENNIVDNVTELPTDPDPTIF